MMSEIDGIYVGLMSGTSLDGISAAVVKFARRGARIEHELLAFHQSTYSVEQRDRIAAAMSRAAAAEYCALSFDMGAWLADAAVAAMSKANVAGHDVRAVASHGQTMWHIPGRSTWQIGESAVIAERTGVDVIADFRVRDVAAGGEGAPLVPIADALLYSNAEQWRLLQNIGGIGNVTVVPPGGDLAGVAAFDTGPGVVLIDYLVRKLFPGMRYDERGEIARSGRADADVVRRLISDPYFAQSPPKSTGREYFGGPYAERLMSMLGGNSHDADIVATAVALTAESIGDALTRFVDAPGAEMVVSGGGARNPTLVDALRSSVAPRRLKLFDELFYDGEAKEAVAFALLGYLHVAGQPGNVIGATGARGPRVLGKLTPA